MFANFDVTPSFLFTVLLACNKLQPSKTQGCSVSPCQYGGTCINNVCVCPPGLTGPTCSNVDCNDYPCFNGGTCIQGLQDICNCPAGYVQPFCARSCRRSRFYCVKGVCVGDVCNCDANFAGPQCESAIFAYLSPRRITVIEGDVGQKEVTIQVCRQPSSEEVTLAVYTLVGPEPVFALPGVDFVNIPMNPGQDVTFSAGQPCAPVNVFILSDLDQEKIYKVVSLVLYDPSPSPSMVHIVSDHISTDISIKDDDHVTDPCASNPCQNGATCFNSTGVSFVCHCVEGFSGVVCDADIEPPTIHNCPDDKTVTAPAGAAATTVSWTPPTATDQSGAVTLTSSQNPGDSFTIGSIQVIYTAIDGDDNMASCRFLVTVLAGEPPPSSTVYLVALVIPVLLIIILLVVIIKRIPQKPASESKPVDVQDVDHVNAGVTDDPEDYIALEEQSRNTPAPKYQDLTEKEAPTQVSGYERTILGTAEAAPKAMPRQGIKSQTDYQNEDVNLGKTDARKLPSVPQPDLQSQDTEYDVPEMFEE